ncbi:GTPase-activator protein for Ras family GTPase [Entamoeba histolytica HM-1:IMSS-B]|uniref:GTPase-activator protein for Ras family GTPase n=5 Tax=Entamoeba histolytica TaxID=5759 RepID=C4LTT7_ENTH1|nr:hypothetical protein EHI_050670 [Entamoeba histolytica HM-1:IMSS]EMD47581.1 gtpaseactivator protein for Ras family gtpase [Entamoeba histolytica KU27]EMH73296.1 GTPase-activator protein for Ras family GTPase [Entamoeba histolytica HM-1:IMSS-B]ENY64004.1 GTPase-activator protein for Ras family GTPase, putative [Entamoeba histolytica HM-1:IMSS-A]GAT91996.1 hypothetical protein CL6EHI_050670 [Entamoeba histolytica]EAL51209.1 hypothetical protein EHI_050670 [Entamoeba histolytica HM-1:IMSS]|eukprot:XP_656593.1 hypothetical protein EHI_050670 [Entamoeba histolytica HM-1:IMSS]
MSVANNLCSSLSNSAKDIDSFSMKPFRSLSSREGIITTTRLNNLVSPPPRSQITITPRKSPEQFLRSSLFDESPSLLFCYCDKLLKRDSSSFKINSLLNFYASRGKVTFLFTKLGEKEISSTKTGTPLLKGNTPFIRLYQSYVLNWCNRYLDEMVKEIEKLKVITGTLDDVDISQDNNREFMKNFGKSLVKNLSYLTSHQRRIIKELCSYRAISHDQQIIKQVFSSLFFLRYCFLPLVKYPSLLKILQKGVSEWIFERTTFHRIPEDPMLDLKNVLDTIFEFIMEYPNSLEVGMINKDKQEESLCNLLLILKDNLNILSAYYADGFGEIFSLVKGNQYIGTSTSMSYALDEIKEWTVTKLETMAQLNFELKMKVQQMREINEKIKQRIVLTSSLFSQ